VRYEFVRDAQPGTTSGTSTLFVDGVRVAEARVGRTMPYAYSTDEGVDVGRDGETPVTEDYRERDNAFNGRIVRVVVSRTDAVGGGVVAGADASRGGR
jgi:arylsulfatase